MVILAAPRTLQTTPGLRKIPVTRRLRPLSLFATTSADSTSPNFLNSSTIDSAFFEVHRLVYLPAHSLTVSIASATIGVPASLLRTGFITYIVFRELGCTIIAMIFAKCRCCATGLPLPPKEERTAPRSEPRQKRIRNLGRHLIPRGKLP